MDTRCDPPGGEPRFGQRSIAGGDSRSPFPPCKRVAASGRRPETRAGGVRQTARPNQRRQAPARKQVGYGLRKEIGDSRPHLGPTKIPEVYLTAAADRAKAGTRAGLGNECVVPTCPG